MEASATVVRKRRAAARIWYQTLDQQLISQGFTRSEYDPCYYYKVYDDGARTDMSIYVDDSWVSDTSGERCDAELAALSKAFKLTVKEVLDAFLGMNLSFPDSSVIELSNEAYIKKLAAEYLDKLLDSYRHRLPAERSLMDLYTLALNAKESGGRINPHLTKSCMSTVGALLYVAPSCRPEVSHCVGILARALTFPTPELLSYAQRVIAWLARRPSDGLRFDGNATDARTLVAYSDSDWSVKQSTTGWCIHLGGAAVAWFDRDVEHGGGVDRGLRRCARDLVPARPARRDGLPSGVTHRALCRQLWRGGALARPQVMPTFSPC